MPSSGNITLSGWLTRTRSLRTAPPSSRLRAPRPGDRVGRGCRPEVGVAAVECDQHGAAAEDGGGPVGVVRSKARDRADLGRIDDERELAPPPAGAYRERRSGQQDDLQQRRRKEDDRGEW